jgi:uncharacterized protein YndB with AHSA1/START domain
MAIIYHQVVIKANRSKIYEAITTQGGLSRWLTPDCVVKPEVGFMNEFRIGTEAHHRMKVVLLQSGHSVEWKCMNQHDDWSGTQLSFHLTEKGGQTCLDFKHTGFSSENEAYAASNYRWAGFLTSLKVYCEAGETQSHGVKIDAPGMALRSGVH